MTNTPQQQTIDPARMQAASQVGAVFNSINGYLDTLKHKDGAGQFLMSKQLEYAYQRVAEASTWAVNHVLMFGAPPAPSPVTPPESNVAEAIVSLEAAELPTANAEGTEPV